MIDTTRSSDGINRIPLVWRESHSFHVVVTTCSSIINVLAGCEPSRWSVAKGRKCMFMMLMCSFGLETVDNSIRTPSDSLIFFICNYNFHEVNSVCFGDFLSTKSKTYVVYSGSFYVIIQIVIV